MQQVVAIVPEWLAFFKTATSSAVIVDVRSKD
jgi:hypothetical protein